MKIINTMETWFRRIVEVLLAILFIGMIVLVAAQVVGRFINVSMAWGEELSRYFMVYSIFFGMTLLYEEHGHVWVANLVNAVPPILRKLMLIVSYIIQVVFFIAVFYGTSQLFPTVAMRTSNVNHIPLNLVYICVPISAAFMLVFCIRDLVNIIVGGGEANA